MRLRFQLNWWYVLGIAFVLGILLLGITTLGERFAGYFAGFAVPFLLGYAINRPWAVVLCPAIYAIAILPNVVGQIIAGEGCSDSLGLVLGVLVVVLVPLLISGGLGLLARRLIGHYRGRG